MKNMLFTGIAGENPAVLLDREQTLGIIVHLRRPSLLQVYYFK